MDISATTPSGRAKDLAYLTYGPGVTHSPATGPARSAPASRPTHPTSTSAQAAPHSIRSPPWPSEAGPPQVLRRTLRQAKAGRRPNRAARARPTSEGGPLPRRDLARPAAYLAVDPSQPASLWPATSKSRLGTTALACPGPDAHRGGGPAYDPQAPHPHDRAVTEPPKGKSRIAQVSHRPCPHLGNGTPATPARASAAGHRPACLLHRTFTVDPETSDHHPPRTSAAGGARARRTPLPVPRAGPGKIRQAKSSPHYH